MRQGGGVKGLAKPSSYTWAHAVNSKPELQVTLAPDSGYDAIEADIIFSERTQGPVMGHPPATDGDLSLQEFLETLVEQGFQGDTSAPNSNIVKLDFKSAKAFESSRGLINEFVAKTLTPGTLFLNADILQGPCDQPCPANFNPSEFLDQAAEVQGAVLSVGWTTGGDNCEYTEAMVDEMLRLLPDRAVTFPIKATCLKRSWGNLKKLLHKENHGLTLWWSQTKLNQDEIGWMYDTLESDPGLRDRTFYDILGFKEFLDSRKG
eukprot:CAMPEP_0184295020 /NCGR_PEP_ID=MMETSP1049-20130417/6024_1 /TAXON_ID=77928 /ORGANISM="Proteomonas sulcata, Strain CCMP704" /LENGTH=262 /DNA_ID=CAMNT_0026603451 /DNA_START=125 /DNA_END=913 /DNA_ORIENTATION=-